MTITAIAGQKLEQLGVNNVSDLAKVTPALVYTQTITGTPDYTLRGVGLNDFALGEHPAVTVYVDEALIPFALETLGAGFDVGQVEVLKGPQGTLFGNNSTGGAISYTTRKPTSDFEAGGSASYGSYNSGEVEGFVSGPVSDTLGVRLAVDHRGSDGWQYSDTHSGHLGGDDFTNGRAIVQWNPVSQLHTQLTLSGWVDNSESPSPQVVALTPAIPPLLPLTGLTNYPLAAHNDRASDWDPNLNYERDNRFYQIAERIDWKLNSALTFTSISSYLDYKQDRPFDLDGTNVESYYEVALGGSHSFNQELRLSGNYGPVRFITGAEYSHDRTIETYYNNISDLTLSFAYEGLGAPHWTDFNITSAQTGESAAAYSNVEVNLTPAWSIQGGVRYTESLLTYDGCTRDAGDGNAAAVYTVALGLETPIQAGQCITLNVNTGVPSDVAGKLNQDNVSWRLGTQYSLSRDALLYINASKGYKAGSFGTEVAITSLSDAPARQESLLQYEAGFKLGLLGRKVQLNGAAFYDDYDHKQTFITEVEPTVGNISVLSNVPRSSIAGGELQVSAVPLKGMSVSVNGSYISTDILSNFLAANTAQVIENFRNSSLPGVPKWQLFGDARYERGVTATLNGFVDANTSYQSAYYSVLGADPSIEIKSHLITGFQLGVEPPGGKWRAYVWGRNIFNTYYWYNAEHGLDTTLRNTGLPATFGATVAYNW